MWGERPPPSAVGVFGPSPLPTKKFAYDYLGRLTKRYGKVGSTTVDENDFAYEEASDVTSATDPFTGSLSVTFQYDHSDPLKHVFRIQKIPLRTNCVEPQ